MKPSHLALITACSFFTLSCGGNDDDNSSGNTDGAATASAFQKYLGKPADLLTEAQAEEICGNPADAEFEVNELPGSMAKYGNIQYQWPSGRKQKVKAGTIEMEVDRPFQLGISLPTEVKVYGDKQTVADAFDQAHKTMTPEQVAAAKKAMNDALKNQNAEQPLDETTKAVGESLTGSILDQAMTTEYVKIDGVGDAAYWEKKERKLDVLSGNLQISITADVAEDDAKCKEAAIKTAKLLME